MRRMAFGWCRLQSTEKRICIDHFGLLGLRIFFEAILIGDPFVDSSLNDIDSCV